MVTERDAVLDGGGNRVGRPNENLAREFMELFTLGVGTYSETDVRQAARALTGWQVNDTTDTAVFHTRTHDAGPETVLGAPGAYNAPSLVDLLITQPASPRFLAQRIWTRFVADTPPDPATLEPLVAAYGPGHDITALLTAAVSSPAFRHPASVLVREPVLWDRRAGDAHPLRRQRWAQHRHPRRRGGLSHRISGRPPHRPGSGRRAGGLLRIRPPVTANANHGTDHGTARPVFLAGTPVRGGFVGAQPSLTDLDNGDLKPTTDFRDVYATLLIDVLHTDPQPILGPGRTTLPLIAT